MKPIQGSRIVYLYRVFEKAATDSGAALAFTTENDRKKSKDADSTATKDGAIRTPGAAETEITATSLLAQGDTMIQSLEDALDNDKLIEIWEVNLDEPGETSGKYKGRYFQGYVTELEIKATAEDMAEADLTFGINGLGVAGEVTVSDEQVKIATYVFRDTEKTGA